MGPYWKGGTFGEADILYDLIFSHVLPSVTQENFSSIAIPAISAGVFGFPAAVSTTIIVEAIKDFLDEKDTEKGALSEIHLLDSRSEIGQAFAFAIQRHFKTAPVGNQKLRKSNASRRGKLF